jgi:adenosylcobinamide-GDP ribazoletransferase
MRIAREARRGLLEALGFLTILPVRVPAPDPSRPALSEAAVWFPLVGALVGGLAGGLRAAAIQLFGRSPSTVLALVALLIMTGALHQDGLADSFDGLGVRGDRGRRLTVMRDSSTGAFGVLALICWGLLLYTAVAPFDGAGGFDTLVAAGTASRLAILAHAFFSVPARPDGLGISLSLTAYTLVAAALSATAIILGATGFGHGALALGTAALAAGAWIRFTRRAFGGRTGDTLGAVSALTEVAVCLALLAVA